MRHRLKLFLPLIAVLLFVTGAQGAIGRKHTSGQYEERVTALFSQHRWAQGKSVLDEALKHYPSSPGLHYLCGRYWFNAKNYDRSRYHLVKACQLHYNHTDAKSLLVNVEEITGNYSSAVCYVNELLEINPYWKGLWLRKVELYKKMGNFEEANSLLRRLGQIYPNDATISSDRYEILESTYLLARRSGNLSAAEEALREMVQINPYDADYQLAYANILIQTGQLNRALDNLTAAVSYIPGNVPIIRKTTDILMETGRNMGALALVRSQMAQYPSEELRVLYGTLLEESARMENEAEAYQLYARVYARKRSMEALSYLLNQSLKRGYYDDALYYISEKRKKTGDSPALVMAEHHVLLDMGRNDRARQVLESGFMQFPDAYDVNLAYSRQCLSDASSHIERAEFQQAVKPLETVRHHAVEEELRQTAVRRLAFCYRETKDFDKAEQMLAERVRFEPEYRVTIDYASLLAKQEREQDALDVLVASMTDNASDSIAVKYLASAYEQTAIPYIRDAMEQGSHPKALDVCDRLLAVNPSCYEALRYAVNASRQPESYIETGCRFYPDDPFFVRRQALLLSDRGKNKSALELLSPLVEEYPGDEAILNSYLSVSGRKADSLYRAGSYSQAASVLDSALVLSPADPSLRHIRGLVFERQHVYDSAFVYQSAYKPSVLEEGEYLSHMRALRNRSYKNSLEAGYHWMRFTDSHVLTGIASLSYSHRFRRDVMGVQLNYTGRDAEWDSETSTFISLGGRGVQILGSYAHDFGQKLTLSAAAGWASAFFPSVTTDLSAGIHLPHEWNLEPALQYRKLYGGGDLMGVSLAVSKQLENFYLGAKASAGELRNIRYMSGLLRARFYPYPGGRDYIEIQGGGGSAPELDIADRFYKARSYNHLNTFAALSGNVLVTSNLMLSASLTWNTFYMQSAAVRYNNMLIAHVQFAVFF